MPRAPKDVTEAELAVLQQLWDQGPVTIRTLTDTLYPDGGGSEYATVQKLLERLNKKGYVERNRETWPHHFTATVGRDELIGRRLQTTADQLCEGALQPLLTTLVKSDRLSAQDRNSLRSLLDELDKDPKQKRS
ncbi:MULTISPECIES: BlaI/MecI/CopY family transcriptional regulator [Novipirellula]|uniref:Penicillinase repressor n=1 Tax=Novipirellula rosea TaxID=1031540 RepID=A0ABP8NE90_9BACT|tara:strand:+ start:1360 stop:1761 length:402 start_codon:yes stop_codon:yes gene_type:complete